MHFATSFGDSLEFEERNMIAAITHTHTHSSSLPAVSASTLPSVILARKKHLH